MRGTRRVVIAASIAAVAATAGACAGGTDKAGGERSETGPVLRLVAYGEPDPDEFVAAVGRLSGGSLRVLATTGWRDGRVDYEQATVEDVRRGDVDLAIVAARVLDLMGTTSFDAVLAPFLVDSVALEARILESPLAAEMLAGIDDAGVVGLGVLPGALRRPIGFRSATSAADDYRDAAVGIRPSRIVERTFRALGARTRPVLFPRDLQAIDAADYTVTSLDFSRYDRAAQTIGADVVLWPYVLVVIGNRERLSELGAERVRLLRKAVREAFGPALERVRTNERTALTAVCGRGAAVLVSTTPADRAALRRAVQPVYDELARDPRTRETLAAIEAMAKPRRDVLSCPAAAPPLVGDAAARALDGTWQWSVTRSELLAAGDTPAGAGRNAGRWRLVLRSGRFELRNLDFGDFYRGAYVLRGDVLSARVDGGRPTDPPSRYTWSLFRGRLSLAPIPGEAFAAAVVAKPLVRAG